MTTLHELLTRTANTRGPGDDVVATERERFVAFIASGGTARRRSRRPKIVISLALGVAVAGAGVATAARLNQLPKEGPIQQPAVKASVDLSPGARLELLGASNAGDLNCPMLRVVRPGHHVADLVCFAAHGDAAGDAVSYASESLPGGAFALYGRAPASATRVDVEFADATRATVGAAQGWYLAVAPSNAATHVTAFAGETQIAEFTPGARAPEAIQVPTCHTPRPVFPSPRPKDDPFTAYVSVHRPKAHLVGAGVTNSGSSWILSVEKRRGRELLSLSTFRSDGLPDGGFGSGGDARVGVSSGTLDDVTTAVMGSVPAGTRCVLVTDSLGRTSAALAVGDPLFPDRKFFMTVVSPVTPPAKVEAFDRHDKRVSVTYT
ncbi:MAG: hypothetical protein QOK28_1929 [Actinomycetota bacterium]|jgi:hypothetical protein